MPFNDEAKESTLNKAQRYARFGVESSKNPSC